MRQGVEQAVQLRRRLCVSGVEILLRVRTASAVTTTLPVENSWLGEFPELGVSTETFWLRQTLYTQTNKRFEDGPRCDRRVP